MQCKLAKNSTKREQLRKAHARTVIQFFKSFSGNYFEFESQVTAKKTFLILSCISIKKKKKGKQEKKGEQVKQLNCLLKYRK